MQPNLADAPPGEIGDPGPEIADLELDRLTAWNCYHEVRRTSEALCAPWKLRITSSSRCPTPAPPSGTWRTPSWFFETFVLRRRAARLRASIRSTAYLFNSYYNAVGDGMARPERGLLSRPTVAEVYAIVPPWTSG